ncbi:conserved exported hypothetical protein [Cupriavidus taiwanensis]|uniref:PepSY domain-containing protein n=2 Tax=Burkholderiaceae TaxID=119060 RepID=A0A375EET3_9BURK|nr:hypothetical protein [Cupriavidus taiwanensis]SOZ72849.1 conserved exported hypothetical protein [Cupriavidus taiwanensis]SOZ73743.1 conserved exported hypothetical protein [Cupriavidus taiwanensis]SOZ75259.1 conserved exported hypothetical protein [Cupriavidus taiwanensis]SPA03742.1 conserved exported hypothetical protein [Cupriavidus taiwanensis]SPA12561.1 conserved exported hypothetical protein [Cupriavidus taiwanensis]
MCPLTSLHLSPFSGGVRRLVRIGLIAAVLGVPGLGHADTDAADRARARAALRSGEILPLSRILDTVARQYSGDVIDVKLDRDDGIWKYEVKLLLPTSTVAKLKYDARDATLAESQGARSRARPQALTPCAS